MTEREVWSWMAGMCCAAGDARGAEGAMAMLLGAVTDDVLRQPAERRQGD